VSAGALLAASDCFDVDDDDDADDDESDDADDANDSEGFVFVEVLSCDG